MTGDAAVTTDRDDAEILFTNERFYAAFARGDADEMARLWGEAGEVCCLHPGWEPLFGRNRVLASWQAILQAPPPVRCVAPRVVRMGPDGGAVICWEEIGGEYLIATNLFRREGDGWRVIHHQAGPVRGAPPDPESEPGRSVN